MRARLVVRMLALVVVGSLAAAGSALAATPSGFSLVSVPQIPGGQLRAVAVTYDSGHTDVWAVGLQTPQTGVGRAVPLILRSTGGAWHRLRIPLTLPPNTSLTDIAAIQGSHPGFWITATPGSTSADPSPAPVLLHWQPSGWTMTTPPTVDTYNWLGSVGSDDAGDVWAGGDASTSDDCCEYPYFDQLSAGSWSNVPLTKMEDEALAAVQPTSATSAWMADQSIPICCDGAENGSLWHYSAGAWQSDNLPCPTDVTESCVVHDLVATTDSNVWIVGSDNAQAAMWHWYGSTAKVYAPWNYPTYHDLFGVAAHASNDVWAVGVRESTAGAYRTLIVHWNGTTWTDLGGPNGPTGNSKLADITVAPQTGAMWAVGTTGDAVAGYDANNEPLILHHP